MANHNVTVNSDLSATPDPVKIKSGDTVTWVGDADFQIILPPGLTNPNVHQSNGRWEGASTINRPANDNVKYSIGRGGRVNDPEIQVLP